MKKFLLSLVALLMSTMMFAGEYTFTYTTGDGSGDGSKWVYNNDQFTITQTKSGSTDINTTYQTLRLYKGHGMSIVANADNVAILSVTFLCDTKDYASTLASCTATTAGSWSNSGTEATFTLATPGASFEFTADKAQVRFSKIVISYSQNGETVIATPEFSIPAGNYYEAQNVSLSSKEGTIYYSLDGENYSKYTAPIAVSATTTISAYCEVDGKKSAVKSVTYAIAKNYASLDELLKETPTADGWPVIVPIENEEIVSFYFATAGTTQYRNGAYLARQAGGKNFELYCSGVPEDWAEGDKVSGIAKGVYQSYNGQWEISLVSWDGLYTGEFRSVLPPTISFDEETKTVTITPADPSYSTFYTLDGTDPTDASEVYEGPFTIEFTTIVKAISTNDDDESSAVATKECSVKMAGATLTDCASLAVSCTATSQDDATEVTFAFSDLLVTGVNGSNVFVSDATGSFLLYGKGATFARGDKLSGNVKGKLYSYNNLPELSVSDWSNVTVASSGNSVTPAKADASAITKADASKFVRFEGLTFDSQETVSNKVNYILKQGDAAVVLRDNFGNLSDIAFNADCKYNLNVFVIPFKDDIQYYAVTVDDIEVVSDKAEAENVFYSDWMINLTDGEFTLSFGADADNDDYYTKSDGARSFTSSDPSVATVDNNGVITPVAPGFTTITFHTASTAKYQEGVATMGLAVISAEHENTLDDPFEVGDVKALVNFTQETDSLWVRGYIVGCVDGSFKNEKAFFGATEGAIDPVNTNILISMNPNAKDVSECIPVELPNKKKIDGVEVREILGLVSHPENLGKEIWIHANPEKYFSVPGLKGINAYSWVGGTGSVKEDVNKDGKVNATDVMLVYNYILSATSPEAKAGEPCDVNGDGKVNATDIMVIYNYILAH